MSNSIQTSALVALLCCTTLGMAQDGAGRPDNRPVNLGVVRQAHVEPRTITVPVVDGKGIRFTRLSTEDGLSQMKVSQIVQDDQGFMWFGSQYGLNRYDGYAVQSYHSDPADSTSLSNDLITRLYVDHRGTLLIGTRYGLNIFDSSGQEAVFHDTAGGYDHGATAAHDSSLRRSAVADIKRAAIRLLHRS